MRTSRQVFERAFERPRKEPSSSVTVEGKREQDLGEEALGGQRPTNHPTLLSQSREAPAKVLPLSIRVGTPDLSKVAPRAARPAQVCLD
jgi:hypothetical protein